MQEKQEEMQEKQEEMQKIFEKWDEIHEDILTSVAKVMELSEKI